MEPYVALYRIESEMKPVDPPQGFLCQAEDGDHAQEQCQNAYPDADVVWTFQGRSVEQALQDYWGHDDEDNEEPVAYNHAFTIAFDVVSRNGADQVTADELYAGIQRRLREMFWQKRMQKGVTGPGADTIVAACGSPWDTYSYHEEGTFDLDTPEQGAKVRERIRAEAEPEPDEEPVAYNHAFRIAFTVVSRNSADQVTADELFAGLDRRLREMTREPGYDEIVEACGLPFETDGYYPGDIFQLEIPETAIPAKTETDKPAWNPDSHWDAHPDFPVEDWRNEVAEDATRQSYREWVLDQIEMRPAEDELDRSMRVGRSSGSSPSP